MSLFYEAVSLRTQMGQNSPQKLSLRTSDRCHWCGNLPDRSKSPRFSDVIVQKSGGLPHQSADWFAMTFLLFFIGRTEKIIDKKSCIAYYWYIAQWENRRVHPPSPLGERPFLGGEGIGKPSHTLGGFTNVCPSGTIKARATSDSRKERSR